MKCTICGKDYPTLCMFDICDGCMRNIRDE